MRPDTPKRNKVLNKLIILLYWLPAVAWASLIFFLSSRPSFHANREFIQILERKLAHVLEFGVLNVLIWIAVRQQLGASLRAVALSAPLSVAYAVTDEYHQTFVTGRSGNLLDIGFDAIGIIITSSLIIIGIRVNQRANLSL